MSQTKTNIKPAPFYKKYWEDSELREWELDDDKFVDYFNKDGAELVGFNSELPPYHIKRRWRYLPIEQEQFYLVKNSIKEQKTIIKELEEEIRQLLAIRQLKPLIQDLERHLNLIREFFPQYLFTQQLYFLKYNFLRTISEEMELLKERKELFTSIEDLTFSGFSLDREKLFEHMKENVNWHQAERDLEIYILKKEKGLNLKEIGAEYGIKYNTVSVIVNKVQGELNRLKGAIFENFVYERLKQSGLFDRIIWEGDIGESDILAYQKEKLYVYSLKNLQIDRDPYWLIVNPKGANSDGELKPEIEFAKLSHFDYEVHLMLVIYDNFHGIIIQKEIDYKNPQNIELSQYI
jgi:hypothetical protein